MLARLAALTPGRNGRSESLSGQSREALLDLLRATGGDLTIEQLSDATGLHPNTVRGHLEVLVAAGEVRRTTGRAQGRGRPPWLYSAVGPNAELVAELDDLLSGLRDTDSSDAFIRDAAHPGQTPWIRRTADSRPRTYNRQWIAPSMPSPRWASTLSCPRSATRSRFGPALMHRWSGTTR